MTEKSRYLKAIAQITSDRALREINHAQLARLIQYVDGVGYISAPQMYRLLRKGIEASQSDSGESG